VASAVVLLLRSACHWGFAALPAARHIGVQVRARSAATASNAEAEPSSTGALRRRDAALAAGLPAIAGSVAAASAPGLPAAWAEAPTASTLPGTASTAPAPAPSSAKLQRLVIIVQDNEALDTELKFWKEAVQMKVLSDGKNAEGNRTVVMAFGPESGRSGGFFGIEFKVDPGLKTRPRPKLLNYAIMQPYVNALNYLQVAARGKSIEIFDRVQTNGGSSLIGDATYVDVESPRGVPVRMVPRDTDPGVELLSFNIEVPAFESTTKFYKRGIGLQEINYPPGEPPIQPLSKYLTSDAGGPNLLLAPVPDKRLKDRTLDEFEGVVMVSSKLEEVTKNAQAAAELAIEEEEAKRKDFEARLKAGDKSARKYNPDATIAKPSVVIADKKTRIDDGLGNIFFLSATADFESLVAGSA